MIICAIVNHICSSHKPSLKTKFAKELAFPNARIKKYTIKMKDRLTNDKNGNLVTNGIFYCQDTVGGQHFCIYIKSNI